MNSQTKILVNHKTVFSNLLMLLFLILGGNAFANTTWHVNGVSGSDSNNCKSTTTACKTIGHAISLAASGDSIMVAAATYSENLTIGISLNMIGAGASSTIVDGGGVKRVVNISSTSAHVTLAGLTIRNGQAVDGGGVYNSGNLTITSTTISGNSASGTPTSGPGGGGIYNVGTLTISNSTVSGNVATPGKMCNLGNHCGSGAGGGIYNGATLTINKSTVSGNLASKACFLSQYHGPHIVCFGGDGGGIYSFGTLTISNSTVSGNVARPGTACNLSCFTTGFGGGISSSSSSTLTISNSTISGNSAYQGGGIDGSATLQNSIVAHSPGGNCSGTMISNGYNMSSDATCTFSNHGDRNNVDPKLGTLGNYGGPTQTIPLLSGSPAIDAGNPSGCTAASGHLLTTDQRGYPRHDPEDTGGCDMGAYEKQSD